MIVHQPEVSHGLLVTTVNSLQAGPEFTGTDLVFVPGCYRSSFEAVGSDAPERERESKC